jgi:fluoroacetyl-CoA thioesterase
MKATLRHGLKHRFCYQVPANKTVPHLYPDVADFQAMPAVFATGFMVGLMEWTCMQLLAPHLDAGEGSLGVHVDVNHTAAAHDGIDPIGEGRHQRFVVAWDKFNARLAGKVSKVANSERQMAGGHG